MSHKNKKNMNYSLDSINTWKGSSTTKIKYSENNFKNDVKYSQSTVSLKIALMGQIHVRALKKCIT